VLMGVPTVAGALRSKSIDRPVAGGGDNPSRRTWRQSGRGPTLHRCGERVLNRLPRDVDVVEAAGQAGHRTTVLLGEHTFDLRVGDGWHVGLSDRRRFETAALRSGVGWPAPSSGPPPAPPPDRAAGWW